MSKVKRFSLEERYGYQNRKVIYDKNADNDIELNNIYPIIDLINQLDEQIADLQHRLEVAEKALSKAVNDKCKAENIIAESIVGKGAKVAVPKKEQWYLEQSEKELKGEKNE